MKVHHVAIATEDPLRLASFYEEVFGLQRLREWPLDTGGVRSVWLAMGEAVLMIERCLDAASPAGAFADKQPGFHLLALRIEAEERASWQARLAGRIVHLTEHTLYVRDPDGNRIGLSHY